MQNRSDNFEKQSFIGSNARCRFDLQPVSARLRHKILF